MRIEFFPCSSINLCLCHLLPSFRDALELIIACVNKESRSVFSAFVPSGKGAFPRIFPGFLSSCLPALHWHFSAFLPCLARQDDFHGGAGVGEEFVEGFLASCQGVGLGPGGEIDVAGFDEGFGAGEVGVGVDEGALQAQFVADDGGEIDAAHDFVETEQQDLAAAAGGLDAGGAGGGIAVGFDDDIRAFAAEAVADGGDGVGFACVDEVFRAERSGHFEAGGVDVYDGDVAVAEEAGDGEQEAALGAGPEDGEGAEMVLADQGEEMDAVGEWLDHDGAFVGEAVGHREDVGGGRFGPLGEGAVDAIHADQSPGGADVDAPGFAGIALPARHEGIDDDTLAFVERPPAAARGRGLGHASDRRDCLVAQHETRLAARSF